MSERKRAPDDSLEGGNAKKFKGDDQAALIAAKRAEIAAKVAAMRNTNLSGAHISLPGDTNAALPKKPATPTPVITVPPSRSSTATPGTPGTPAPAANGITDDLARRVAEAKRKVAEYQSKLAVKDNPYMSLPQTGKSNKNWSAEPSQQGSGLKMTAHPLLLDSTPTAPQSKKDRYKPMQPKFASIKANARNTPTPTPPPAPAMPIIQSTSNPYASSSKDVGFEGAPKERSGRSFRFNPKGKFVALGNQMRQEQQLEALRQRIAESARKAGLDGDMGIERNIKRPPPPQTEWWDAPLLPTQSYSDITNYGMSCLDLSTVTIYIQHPIKIPPPGDKNKVALKPLMLTKKEQKKMRKLRRASELQDKRDRIRMGLLPPDPPKVRLANLMKVLTSDAIQDPTRVEAKVRREVAMRKHQHEKTNAERKLTDEQRREKVENKKIDEEKKGIFAAVFKIKNLTDPSHQFKVRKNAEQLNLTGVCIFNPNFSLVYVEGAAKFIRNYKRLMLVRIDWTQGARSRGGEEVVLQEEEGAEDGAGNNQSGSSVNDASGSGANGVAEPSSSLEDNKCVLVWEGLLKDRAFTGFKPKHCPTDGAAKELLGERLRGYWDIAKNWKMEEEDLI
ncbi:pre-mRNA processing factor 3-domain-containing protein [Lentinula raphanica]|uniref:Pre-mRNA processing factor 3-domain-containing protein n=1 Tax=Lentinula raphanica TaxID=153919 RepID=A0AA38PA31_9AGAR|nr:pre-mRNA processing factor 3-domain-containing protein [Lentinula raphanica]KAJ3839094.1 pre-mRNA processing factor 3-domain-containing protein [Lentinula raphanica]